MTIRTILTAGTLSALVGIAGVVPGSAAFADSYLDLGPVPQAVQTVDAQLDHSSWGDAYLDHEKIVENVATVEEALLLDTGFDAFDIN